MSMDGILSTIQQTPTVTPTDFPIPTPEKPDGPLLSNLSSYVRKCWEKAYQAKQPVHKMLLDNKRAVNSEYSPEKLAEIRKLRGSEIYVALTATKKNAAVSWINDIIFQPGQEPWDIEPTPIPELPMEVVQEIQYSVMMETWELCVQYASIMRTDPQSLFIQLQPKMEKRIQRREKEKAVEGIEDLKEAMRDQMAEGGYYDALKEVIADIVEYKAGIMKGPVYRKKKYFKRSVDPLTGQYSNTIEEKVVPTFERRSPFNIFPSPDCTGPNEGYLCDLLSLSVKQLSGLKGVEGFDDSAIDRVLLNYNGGGLREWATTDITAISEQSGGTRTTLDTDMIDVVEFNGDIKGDLLLQWGMDPADVPDRTGQYEVCVWLIGNEVIKAMLNPDPMGNRPFSVTSYLVRPGSFWGDGLPDLIADIQQICNAMARAMSNNAGIASGPLTEWNSSRIDTKDQYLFPWKVIEATDDGMTGAPAVRFYQPQLVVDQLLNVFDYFSKLADQYSIPSYSHGDTNVGGAGNTASGLSMMMASTDRVIKNVIKNIDSVIERTMRMLYFYNIYYLSDRYPLIGDVEVVAKGSSSMFQKEQRAVRRSEFATVTNNPADLEILGLEGRRELLKQTAKTIDLENLTKIFPEIDEIDELKKEIIMIQQNMMAQAEEKEEESGEEESKSGKHPPEKNPKAIDYAGNTQSGQDMRLFRQNSVGQM